MLRNLSVLILIALIFLLPACGQKSEDKGVKLALNILPETLTDCLYIKMNYQFQLAEDFSGLDDQYRIFIHFWRLKNKEMLLQDDHMPEKSFSQWQKGETISYSRIVFIPQFLEEFDEDFDGYEKVRLTVGLYRPEKEQDKTILFQEELDIQSATLNAPEKVFDEGWHPQEEDERIKNPDERSWRWTKKRAVCIIENPRKDSLLIIRGGIDRSKFDQQKVTFKINDTLLEEFMPETGKFTKEYVITPAMMGQEDEFRLIIETDKSFVPSELNPEVKDDRELGVQIYFLYFRENVK